MIVFVELVIGTELLAFFAHQTLIGTEELVFHAMDRGFGTH